MLRQSRALVVMTLAGAVAGCAQANLAEGTALSKPLAAGETGTVTKAGYVLSADEQALECKQLTGRMQIRILEIRDYNERSRSTLVARALQSGSTAVFGGPKTGADPDGAYAKDRAILEAYNQQLLAKGCRAFDLESELQPQDVRVTPAATIKPARNDAK